MEKNKQNRRQFGLIGKNIDYSFSRNYFAQKFNTENLNNCHYKNFDLISIEEVKPLLASKKFTGLNVTIPYKKEIIPFLDELSEEAKEIGAVNTICFRKDRTLHGANTDCYGFEKALRERVKRLPKKALIIGTGGASAAITYVLDKNNIEPQFISRKPKEGQLSYSDLQQIDLQLYPLIINTSPVGTYPNVSEAPKIPYHQIKSDHILFDLIYNPEKTQFLKNGLEKGATIINGYTMLIYQAEKAWELWNS